MLRILQDTPLVSFADIPINEGDKAAKPFIYGGYWWADVGIGPYTH